MVSLSPSSLELRELCRLHGLHHLLPLLEHLLVLLHLGAHQHLGLQRTRDRAVHVLQVQAARPEMKSRRKERKWSGEIGRAEAEIVRNCIFVNEG